MGRVTAHVVTHPRSAVWRALRDVGASRRFLAGLPGVTFSVVGRSSGGTGVRNVNRTLSPRRLVVLTDCRDREAAERCRAALDDRWRAGGAAVWSALLAPIRSSGTWRGVAAFAASGDGPGVAEGPLVSITYARIRPTRLGHFYVLGFPRTARRMTGDGSPMVAGIGFGDVPVRHACTLSVWPSGGELVRLVQGRSEPHGAVARRSTGEGWLAESLFARCAVLDHAGDWAGDDPLA